MKYNFSRYERQIDLTGFGIEGQTKLKNANISIIGVGGLGCPVSLYLTAAGVGSITLADDDQVSLANLQRQILYKSNEVGQSKIDCAKKALLDNNPETQIRTFLQRIDQSNFDEILGPSNIIIDCSDNFDTRYFLNEYALTHDKILISGSSIYFDGQVFVFKRGYGCYSCLFPNKPLPRQLPTCTEEAILGPVVGIIGTLMAVETIKEIVTIGDSLAGSFLSYSSLKTQISKIAFDKNPNCPVCTKAKNG